MQIVLHVHVHPASLGMDCVLCRICSKSVHVEQHCSEIIHMLNSLMVTAGVDYQLLSHKQIHSDELEEVLLSGTCPSSMLLSSTWRYWTHCLGNTHYLTSLCNKKQRRNMVMYDVHHRKLQCCRPSDKSPGDQTSWHGHACVECRSVRMWFMLCDSRLRMPSMRTTG